MEEIKETEKLFLIEEQIKKFKLILNKASEAMLEQNISQYPIFVMHKQVISIGLSLIERGKHDSDWSINVSNLEEFIRKQLIFDNKAEEFKQTYKDPTQNLCLFVLSDLGAQFLFLPK